LPPNIVLVPGRKVGIRAACLEQIVDVSRHLRERLRRIERELSAGGLQPDPGKAKLVETRRAVVAGYHSAAEVLLQAGQAHLAQELWGFIGGLSAPRTTDEQLAATLARKSPNPRTVKAREYSR